MKTGKLYIPTAARVTLSFEKDHICCAFCPCFETYSRAQCRLTGEYIVDKFGRGYWCPLELEGESNEYPRKADFDSAGAKSSEEPEK